MTVWQLAVAMLRLLLRGRGRDRIVVRVDGVEDAARLALQRDLFARIDRRGDAWTTLKVLQVGLQPWREDWQELVVSPQPRPPGLRLVDAGRRWQLGYLGWGWYLVRWPYRRRYATYRPPPPSGLADRVGRTARAVKCALPVGLRRLGR